jgi:RimJ/RimL family protein N-acetyltransferase
MWIAPVALVGRAVRLEPLEARHAGDLLGVADPELFRHTPQTPHEWSVAGFEQEIERVRGDPNGFAFAIVRRDTGRAIGCTTFMEVHPDHRGLEIGRTWIGRAHHGTRVNPEIKYLMLRHAFEELVPTAIRVQLTTGGTNLHSQAAIAKLGAVREGVLRKNRLFPRGPDPSAPQATRDIVVYSILDDEWPAVRLRLEERLRPMP